MKRMSPITESVKAANLIVMKTPDKGVYVVTKDIFVKEKDKSRTLADVVLNR